MELSHITLRLQNVVFCKMILSDFVPNNSVLFQKKSHLDVKMEQGFSNIPQSNVTLEQGATFWSLTKALF